ncbi:hypothetical protein HDV00_008773, partial [Rhizophlyctis rosea]
GPPFGTFPQARDHYPDPFELIRRISRVAHEEGKSEEEVLYGVIQSDYIEPTLQSETEWNELNPHDAQRLLGRATTLTLTAKESGKEPGESKLRKMYPHRSVKRGLVDKDRRLKIDDFDTLKLKMDKKNKKGNTEKTENVQMQMEDLLWGLVGRAKRVEAGYASNTAQGGWLE